MKNNFKSKLPFLGLCMLTAYTYKLRLQTPIDLSEPSWSCFSKTYSLCFKKYYLSIIFLLDLCKVLLWSPELETNDIVDIGTGNGILGMSCVPQLPVSGIDFTVPLGRRREGGGNILTVSLFQNCRILRCFDVDLFGLFFFDKYGHITTCGYMDNHN